MDPDYPFLSVFLYMLWFFVFILWLFLLFTVFNDIFRSSDLSGWGKAGWSIFIIFLPLLGVLAYLIARGDKMHERMERASAREEEAFRDYVRTAAGAPSVADELQKLRALLDSGAITPEEFERAKTRLLAPASIEA